MLFFFLFRSTLVGRQGLYLAQVSREETHMSVISELHPEARKSYLIPVLAVISVLCFVLGFAYGMYRFGPSLRESFMQQATELARPIAHPLEHLREFR